MLLEAASILSVLDRCCDAFTFPMLDNGYVYLAATRLSLYRTVADWAMVIEVFGFSPRSGLPDTHIHTFASTLYNRDVLEKYINREGHDRYLANNPNNDSRFVFPIDAGDWQDDTNDEMVAKDAREVVLRGQMRPIPSLDEYAQHGIAVENPPRVRVFELCRFLADVARDSVLATAQERCVSVLPEMTQILRLEDWHHPNVAEGDDRPSASESFQQLAQVLATGDGNFTNYRPKGRLLVKIGIFRQFKRAVVAARKSAWRDVAWRK
jgi:hypothetical protein